MEAAGHLVNLIADEDFHALSRILADPKSPEEVQETIISDTINRPNSLKLPLLLELARNPQHPKATEAKDILGLYLEEDFGEDWNKWQAATEKYLKENPD